MIYRPAEGAVREMSHGGRTINIFGLPRVARARGVSVVHTHTKAPPIYPLPLFPVTGREEGTKAVYHRF